MYSGNDRFIASRLCSFRARTIGRAVVVVVSLAAASVLGVGKAKAQSPTEPKPDGERAGASVASPVVRLVEATVKLANPKSTASAILVRAPSDVGQAASAASSSANAAGNSPEPPRNELFVVTAAHVLEAVEGNSVSVLLRPRGPDGQYQKHVHELVIRRDGQPLWKRHEAADVAVIRATFPENLQLTAVPAEWLADDNAIRARKLDPGELIRIVGFPHRIEGNGAGFPVVRLGCLATYPLVPLVENRTVLFDGNTFEGDSGGPAYVPPRDPAPGLAGNGATASPGPSPNAEKPASTDAADAQSPLILGLVVGQHFLDEEMKTIYGYTKTRHRLGLGIIAPAPFIRQLLK